jgi:hypothetical protein
VFAHLKPEARPFLLYKVCKSCFTEARCQSYPNFAGSYSTLLVEYTNLLVAKNAGYF